MKARLLLVIIVMFFGVSSSSAQEVGDEKEPTLRAELVRLVKEDQEIRGEFAKYKKQHGLFVDDKTLNEKLNSDEALKKGFLDIANRMTKRDADNLLRMKEIIAKYGWTGKSLVGTDGATAAWLLVQHSDRDVAFQRLAL